MLIPQRPASRQSGFSMLELSIVMVIALILASMQVPQAVNMMHVYRLNNATLQFSGLAQSARSSAVHDSSYYSMYFVSDVPITEAFVGIKGTMLDYAKDPLTTWSSEVTPKAASSAPATAALETSAFLSSGSSSSAITVIDGFVVSGSGITFSAMGTPCVPATRGTAVICNSSTSSTAVAYWTFFQNSVSKAWEAVTITPAGKTQRWTYNGAWKQL